MRNWPSSSKTVRSISAWPIPCTTPPNAAPAQPSARTAFLLAGLEPVPIGTKQCLIKKSREFAAVVTRAVGRFVWHHLRKYVVATTQFDSAPSHLGRRGVDQTFHIVIALGPPGTPISPYGLSIRDYKLGRHLEERRPVDPYRVLHCIGGRRDWCAAPDIGAEIAVAAHPYSEKVAVDVECQLAGHLVVAAMAVGNKTFAALVGPLDRAAERLGGVE